MSNRQRPPQREVRRDRTPTDRYPRYYKSRWKGGQVVVTGVPEDPLRGSPGRPVAESTTIVRGPRSVESTRETPLYESRRLLFKEVRREDVQRTFSEETGTSLLFRLPSPLPVHHTYSTPPTTVYVSHVEVGGLRSSLHLRRHRGGDLREPVGPPVGG